MKKELSLQQDKFCELVALYGRGGGTKAAKEANYSEKSAKGIAYSLLRKPEIQERVEYYKKKIAAEIQMKPGDIIARLQKIAKRQDEYKGTVKDAREALKDLAKYHGMRGFTDKLIIEHKMPFDDWTVVQIDEFIEKGVVPKGKKLPDLESLGEMFTRTKSQESGEGIT